MLPPYRVWYLVTTAHIHNNISTNITAKRETLAKSILSQFLAREMLTSGAMIFANL